MPRDADHQVKSSRREQILAAAAELFARYGFHGVGMDDIGAAVGISGPALYRHFRSKDSMLAEMLTDISDRLLTGARTRVQYAGNTRQALDDLVRWHIEFALTNPSLITVHMRDLANLPDSDQHHVRELQRAYVEVWVTTLRALHPRLDQSTARAISHAVLGLINSTPYSTHVNTQTMSGLLRRMALAALTADHE